MNFQKRDLIALLLCYVILQLTLFDDYYESSIKASIQFLFYSEYTSSPQPCYINTFSTRPTKIESRFQDRFIDHKCDSRRRMDAPIRSARPLFLLEELLMVVPFLTTNSQNAVNYNNEVELRIVDISPWKLLKNREQIRHPFYAERLDILSLKNTIGSTIDSENNDEIEKNNNGVGYDSERERFIKIPLKLKASPFIPLETKEKFYYSKQKSTERGKKNSQMAKINGHRFIISIWNDGSIALHKIEKLFGSQRSTNTTNEQQSKLEKNNRLIWVNRDAIVDASLASSSSNFLEHFHLTAVDAIFHFQDYQEKDQNKDVNGYNVVLIHATIESLKTETEQLPRTLRISMQLENGSIVWSHTNEIQKNSSNKDQASSSDCLQLFQSSVMDEKNLIFPHSFWNQDEDSIQHLANFQYGHHSDKNPNKESQHDIESDNNFKPIINDVGSQIKTQVVPTKQFLMVKDANVIINHDQYGIQAFTLSNGDPVCHLNLKSVGYTYADLNQDGEIDQIHIPSIDISNRNQDSIYDSQSSKDKQWEENSKYGHDRSCSITAHSGLPAKEDLFYSNSLCSGNESGSTSYSKVWNKWKNTHGLSYSSAQPLIAANHYRGVTDVFLAFHHGEIMKFEVPIVSPNSNDNQRIILTSDNNFAWQSLTQKTPKWNPNPAGQGAAYITSLPSSNGKAILVSGEEGMSVLSYSSGRVLTNTIFPQKSTVHRPLVIHVDHHRINRDFLEDENKDEDIVLVFSIDGVWGYAIAFETTLDFWTFFAICLCMTTIALLLHKSFVKKDNLGNHRCMSWDPW